MEQFSADPVCTGILDSVGPRERRTSESIEIILICALALGSKQPHRYLSGHGEDVMSDHIRELVAIGQNSMNVSGDKERRIKEEYMT